MEMLRQFCSIISKLTFVALQKKTQTKAKSSKPKTVKFTLDCSKPVDDGIFDPAAFEKFLHDRIKVNGKAGALGETVKLVRDKSKIHVTAVGPFSKRYLKYLTKKYLKAQKLRDWLHVVATTKSQYELRYVSAATSPLFCDDAFTDDGNCLTVVTSTSTPRRMLVRRPLRRPSSKYCLKSFTRMSIPINLSWRHQVNKILGRKTTSVFVLLRLWRIPILIGCRSPLGCPPSSLPLSFVILF
jgi:large subunit ribosomal protein L22e